MMRISLKFSAWLVLPAFLMFTMPEPAHADNSSDGAAISLGILAASVVVLLAISLSSDIERWRTTDAEPAQPLDMAQVRESIPLVVKDLRPMPSSVLPEDESARLEDFGVGLSFEF